MLTEDARLANERVHELLIQLRAKIASAEGTDCRVMQNDETAVVRDTLLELLQQYPTQGKQVHDANIVATMLAYKIDTLLTLNVADLKRFGDKIKIISLA